MVVVGIAAGTATAVGYRNVRPAESDLVTEAAGVVVDRVPVSPARAGTVETVLVKPGQTVKAGDLVAVLDDHALQASIQADQKALQDAQKETVATGAAILPPAVTGTLPPPIELPTTPLPAIAPVEGPLLAAPNTSAPDPAVVAATAKKALAQKALLQANAEESVLSDQLAAAKADLAAATQQDQFSRTSLESAQAGLDMAKTELDKFRDLYNQGIISRYEFQQKQADFDAANAAATAAQKQSTDADAAIKLRQDTVDKDQKLLDDATTKVASAKKMADSIVVPAPRPVVQQAAAEPIVALPKPVMPPPLPAAGPLAKRDAAVAFAPVGVAFSPVLHAKAQSQLKVAQATLSKDLEALQETRIVAPADGFVASVEAKPGDKADPAEPILTVMRPVTARVIATLPHSSALRVRPGAACVIQLVEHPQERFAGTVDRFVGPVGPVSQVEIQVGPDAAALGSLPAGTPLRVTIHTR